MRLVDIGAYLSFPARILARPGQRRHLARWLRSLAPGYLLRQAVPWLTFDAICALDRVDLAGRSVFEYGSGGSTRYWLARGATVISVEHDTSWYDAMRALLPADAALDYRLVTPERAEPAQGDVADPAAYRSAAPEFRAATFRRYAAAIDQFDDGSLDLVLVDGRARPACLAHAAPKVRPGGLLILDNSDRAYYTARLAAALVDFTPQHFPGVVPHTAIFSQTTLFWRAS